MKTLRSLAGLALVFAASPAWADNLAGGSPSDLLDYDDEWVTGLEEPTSMAFLPDGRVLITQRRGTLRVRTTDGELVDAGSIAVSTSFQEKGLLNVLPHPDYATNHLIFLYYTGSGGGNDDNRVVSMELSDDNVLDTESEIRLMEGVRAPLNHDGGGLATDGTYLYIGTGDSGSNSNKEPKDMVVTNYLGTCLTVKNGKILRLNFDGSIPADNPLVGVMVQDCADPGDDPTASSALVPADEAIFAWGFRNAFRVWHDPKSNNLWVGHVGEVTYEMISVVPPTGNVHMGWPFREGNEGQAVGRCQDVIPNVGDCKASAYRCESSSGNPGSADYNADVPDLCDSITGGLILTGCEWPMELEGQYVFGDYANEMLWTLEVNDERNAAVAERVDFGSTQGGGPVAFVEHEGALYVTVYTDGGGHITKITPKTPDASCEGEMPPPASSEDPDTSGTPGTDGPDTGSSDTETSDPGTGVPTPPDGESSVDNPGPPSSDTETPATDTPEPIGTPGPNPTTPGAPTDSGETGGPVTPPPTGPAATTPPVASTSSAGPTTPVESDGGQVGAAVADDKTDDGCGCRVIGNGDASSSRSGALAFAGVGLLLSALRRRRSR